ncbi:helix-turn-helix transcriptional regulator [Paenibacillus xerothermodurans]|uniref:AraC family transcriptional regulator n=1 Tax=Paenibacillus xerothermodurans TaxID=1977292 RepID=A0A2W1NQA2_PAEXE|nr:AraC family transcriptional regulator [Paenibacillus xerothermodurans]PZE21083.1 AraC family transcriptional regulator [Paenibacillus xerothermodurans]
MQTLKADIQKPMQFISAGQFVSEVPWSHSRRSIDSYEVIIGVQGTLYIQQEDTPHEVKPGDVLLLLPNRVHFGHAVCDKDVSFFWFHFHCSGNHTLIDDARMAEELRLLRTRQDAEQLVADIYIPLFSTPRGIERLNILFQQLLHVANANYYTYQGTHYLLTTLLIELSEQTISEFTIGHNKKHSEINLARIMEWTRIHALTNISVCSIAEKFNYNKDYLSRFFKQKTGMNLQEYIHLLKLGKAKDLLSRTNQNIKEIAQTVGIRDEKYFMKLFKKYEQMTPSEFRKAFYLTHMNNK